VAKGQQFDVKYNARDIARLRKRIKDLDRSTMTSLRGALFQEGLEIAKESMKRTPVLTGALRASHEVERPTESGSSIEVRIKVGGPAAGYALAVHEEVLVYHKVGGPKFLQAAMNNARAGMSKRITRRAGG
jgi:hypothetical protein